ncbi:hypothetical protein DSL72_006573 [Monilinia vaccinii-corymbosi]|uniref:Uncharacterized protein n=1 Tax=Monilinia vaccinii-corymbosi TaxID=61207 RepID=A0A8A3PMK4_9HELO|nr:hypothetical protein DSL72_006573 [Monilinia vaccinii-corymbosi]
MAPYGFQLGNITSSYNMTTSNVLEQVDSAVSIAAGILASTVFSLVTPVNNFDVSASSSSMPVHDESSASFPLPSPDVVVITTSSTITIPFVNFLVPATTSSSTGQTIEDLAPDSVYTALPYDVSTLFVEPSSTLDIAPSSTISLPTPISSPAYPLSTSTIFSTTSTPIPLNIVPITLTTLASPSPLTPSPSSNDFDAAIPPAPGPTSNKSSPSHTGAYVGAAVGSFILLLTVLLSSLVCLSRRRKHHQRPKHHPDRPAFIGGYELKLDKAGDLQRVVHEKRVRRKTFEAWKTGVVPDVDPPDVAGKSEFHAARGSPQIGYASSLGDGAEEESVPQQRVRGEGDVLAGDDHDAYIVSPMDSPIEEEQRGRRWPDEHAQSPRRPASGIKPLICEWEKRGDSRSRSISHTSTIGKAL